MKRLVLFVCWLCLASSICAAMEYRDFRDSQGRLIRARVLKFDARTEMVTIQREGMRASKVPLNIFSEADQAYISKKIVNPLSKKEVKAIAKEYAEALKHEDVGTINNLFHRHNWEGWRYGNVRRVQLKSLDFGKVDGNNIHVTLDGYKEDIAVSGWIQLTPDGKIKYCPLTALHPVEKATMKVKSLHVSLKRTELYINKNRILLIKDIEKTGIPTFGLHQEMTKSEMQNAIEGIQNWLIENCGQYDNSEPELFLPEKRIKFIIRELESF